MCGREKRAHSNGFVLGDSLDKVFRLTELQMVSRVPFLLGSKCENCSVKRRDIMRN